MPTVRGVRKGVSMGGKGVGGTQKGFYKPDSSVCADFFLAYSQRFFSRLNLFSVCVNLITRSVVPNQCVGTLPKKVPK